MKKKEYKFGLEAREAIRKVATTTGEILGKTLGPAGRNFQIPSGITNDGRSILAHIRFVDECEDNVALAFHEVANRTDRDAGDGTTTAVVLATELTKSLIDTIPDLDAPIPGQKSVMELSRHLEVEKDKAIELLKAKVQPVTTLEQLEKVAFTSMEDRDAAKIVAETIFKAGKDSFTALEEGFTGKLETNVQAGIEMPLQVAAPFMYNKGKEASYDGNIPVFVANHIFEEYREITPFMQTMVEFSKQNNVNFPCIVIVGKQFSIPFVQAVSRVFFGSQGKINIILLANTHLADDLFEDLSAFVDSKYIDTHPKGGKKITDAIFKYCGYASKVVATPKGAVFYGGRGTVLLDKPTTRVQARILEIQEQLKEEKSNEKRSAMERRIAEFQGGKATVYVDAKTPVEKYYLKLKVEDCLNSCKSALEGGMVRGGGIALKEVAEEMGEDALLYKALKSPYERIQQNAGGALEIGEDVFDSFLCVQAAVANAVSVVRVILTIEGIVADVPVSLVEDLRKVMSE
ncbi:MAG: TCP-1/cpn60 chaperonin family protein [bacterium]|nr:TCP-1/cpn60 chaperonin family protein [bacterium]